MTRLSIALALVVALAAPLDAAAQQETAPAEPAAPEAPDPGVIARDFCHAVAAASRCRKAVTMPDGTEARLTDEAGARLRGDASPTKAACSAGYAAFFADLGRLGRDEACNGVLALFGPDGGRRAGLLAPRDKPKLMLPEDEVAAIASDLCYADQVAKSCSGFALTDGLDARLAGQTGVDLRAEGSYFEPECSAGTFAASMARGRSATETFCADGLARFGPAGTDRAGFLTGDAPDVPATPVATSPAADPTTGRPRQALVVLTALPPLPIGKTAEDVLGFVPGGLPEEACAERLAARAQNIAALGEAKTLGETTRLAVRIAADIKLTEAVCGGAPAEMPDAAAAAVAASGLEACHIVFEETEALDGAIAGYLNDKRYRAMLAVEEARFWALEAFAPACSTLTERRMTSAQRFARTRLIRDQKTYPCLAWQNFIRDEQEAVRALKADGDWMAAIERLDNRLAPAIHGLDAACDKQNYVESNTKYWLFQRRQIQAEMAEAE
ncbi:hypothetical protein [Rhodobium gokarnense]|uniref:Lysozyme inhibitor LprI N-terminal domain-containing protein n=1 Tax=Rhodobium gokarnense TaxID=364296 RepID=A0ABT3H611_9HYPH|nr:hypothetical protein [Rhodobium gokarnense]MCW2305789.1 hypothetical protein [Rhodobium gokarnense]